MLFFYSLCSFLSILQTHSKPDDSIQISVSASYFISRLIHIFLSRESDSPVVVFWIFTMTLLFRLFRSMLQSEISREISGSAILPWLDLLILIFARLILSELWLTSDRAIDGARDEKSLSKFPQCAEINVRSKNS